uniref:Peptidase M1 membrane alanine aminopeptidase domain-containing protein n=1 Tax=Megaselia scalaris TaxID=36166 RepID=T1H2C8_MEGSC
MNVIQFSEKYGANVLQYFMDTFTTAPLPLEIMKQVPLPDFHFSGMENFGITTYREGKLFFDPKLNDARQLMNILYLMGHEMAHNWFGNLVTMDWWTFVWMKEGFSTMYSYYAANEVKNTPYLTQDERKTIQQSIYQQSSLGVNTILEFWDSSPKLFVEVMGKDNVNDLIIDISNYCYTDRQQKKVKDAFRDSPKKSSIELNIEVNRKWANMHGNSIDSYYNSAFSFSINISLIAFVLFVLNRLV